MGGGLILSASGDKIKQRWTGFQLRPGQKTKHKLTPGWAVGGRLELRRRAGDSRGRSCAELGTRKMEPAVVGKLHCCWSWQRYAMKLVNAAKGVSIPPPLPPTLKATGSLAEVNRAETSEADRIPGINRELKLKRPRSGYKKHVECQKSRAKQRSAEFCINGPDHD
jgi:hypothetical protein